MIIKDVFARADNNPNIFYRASYFDTPEEIKRPCCDEVQSVKYKLDPNAKLTPDAFIKDGVVFRQGLYVTPTLETIDKYIDGVQYSYWYFGGDSLAIIEGDVLDIPVFGSEPEHLIVPRKVHFLFPNVREHKEYYGDFDKKFLESSAKPYLYQ